MELNLADKQKHAFTPSLSPTNKASRRINTFLSCVTGDVYCDGVLLKGNFQKKTDRLA